MQKTIACFLAFAWCASLSADTRTHMNLVVFGGKSVTTWHGQADVQAVHLELTRNGNSRLERGLYFGGVNLWQPRSWFGDLYGDGNESVQALSTGLIFRYHLGDETRAVRPYFEVATGPLWAERRVPADTSRFNFMSQGGAGVTLFANRKMPLIVGYRFMHISNGGYSPRNPGLNVSSLVVGTRF